MGKNTSISLGDHFEAFIAESILKGRFQNASEVIKAGLRLLEEEEDKVFALKNTIQEGVDSGRAENFNSQDHLKMLKARKK